MQISLRLVKAYQDLYEQRFCQSITANEAERQLSNLAELIRSMVEGKKNNYGK